MVVVPEKLITIKPVGVVVSDYKEFSFTFDYNRESMIYMREDLTDALIGLEYFSHLQVIYHQNRRHEWLKWTEWGGNGEAVLKIPYSSDNEPGFKGVYSTRSPARPSGMGSCIAQILKREGNCIYVKGLDAFNGTPVMDIKVYIPDYDAFPMAEVPVNWCKPHIMADCSRLMHWDTSNVSLTLGLRAGARALQEVGSCRGQVVKVKVAGGYFFAQGIEAATGCSVMRDNMTFEESNTSLDQWELLLFAPEATVLLKLNDLKFSGADEVINISEDKLFSTVEIIK